MITKTKIKEIKKELGGWIIADYHFHQHPPFTINDARLTVSYMVGTFNGDKFIPAVDLAGYQQKIEIFNIGENKFLTDFLNASGSGTKDLYDFNYHDLERIVEEDVKEKFGLTAENK